MKKIDRFLTSGDCDIYGCREYVGTDFFVFDKSLSEFAPFRQFENKNHNLLTNVPFEFGTEIQYPKMTYLGRYVKTYFIIEHENRFYPFNYEWVKLFETSFDIEYVTIVKALTGAVLKMYDENEKFIGLIMSCISFDSLDSAITGM